jgi:hypothetical protein
MPIALLQRIRKFSRTTELSRLSSSDLQRGLTWVIETLRMLRRYSANYNVKCIFDGKVCVLGS